MRAVNNDFYCNILIPRRSAKIQVLDIPLDKWPEQHRTENTNDVAINSDESRIIHPWWAAI